ncbi:DUF1833 family protein [Methylobacterium sp. ID0610]|uniref:DUF1833 family protein n=1 Tax=Methylobacterium carpenticola TaxID=3344827 RepID=UPI003677A588
MTLKLALQEAYASGDEEGVIIDTVQIDHPSLDAPIYLACNIDSALGDPGDTIGLPIVEGGPKVPHLLCAFGVIRPGADEDGPTDGKLQIDNASDLLHDLLKNAVGYDAEVLVTFRAYRVLPGHLDDVTGPDDDTLSGLELTQFEVTAAQAEGTLSWPDGRQQNVPTGPHAFFDRDEYPSLFS